MILNKIQKLEKESTVNYNFYYMKSNQNSKKENNSLNRISMLLQKPNTKRIISQVPNDLPVNTLNIDISHNAIRSLGGIQKYKLMQVLNISYNNLAQFQEFRFLFGCGHLKELWMEENPVCTKINYFYGIFCTLKKVITINGLQLNTSLEQILKWQKQNGSNLIQFLMQSCVIINEAQKNTNSFDKRSVKKQLKIIQNIFNGQKAQKWKLNEQIKNINDNMYRHLVLQSMQVPDLDQHQIKDIKDYVYDKIIQIGSNQNSQFIANLLTQIQVNGQDEQKQFVQKPKIVHFILKGLIDKYFTFYHHISPEKYPSKQQDNKIRHYLSAETALQTLQTGKRHQSGLVSFHFCLDSSYLKIVNEFIGGQISRLLNILEQKEEGKLNNYNIRIETYENHLQTFGTYQQDQILKSPKIVYTNSVILNNLLELLQSSIQRIAFRKIKNCRSKANDHKICSLVQSSFSKLINVTFQQSFNSIRAIMVRQRVLIQKFNTKKLRIILKAWRNIKKRKMKLLKNIIKHKIKVDNFLSSVLIAKWRMNARAQKIKQMANSIISGTYNQSVPKSKKGIQLAYKRAIENKRSLL